MYFYDFVAIKLFDLDFDYSIFPDLPQPWPTEWNMRLAAALISGLLLAFQGGEVTCVRVPTKGMMINGLTVYNSISDLSLSQKGI